MSLRPPPLALTDLQADASGQQKDREPLIEKGLMNGSRLFVRLPPSRAAARGLDGTQKSLPFPRLQISCNDQGVAHVRPRIEATGSIRDET